MSAQTFQSYLVRLIIDPDFRDRLRLGDDTCLAADLTEREQARLRLVARHRGMDVNRTLHKGFRLGKLRALLPMTCTLLGSRRLADELAVFWRKHLPGSFYYLPEALSFCRHLQVRISAGLDVAYLEEVVGYEQAVLELQQAGNAAQQEPRHLAFRHDPRILLSELAHGRVPAPLPEEGWLMTVTAKGEQDVNGDGRIEWRLVPASC